MEVNFEHWVHIKVLSTIESFFKQRRVTVWAKNRT